MLLNARSSRALERVFPPPPLLFVLPVYRGAYTLRYWPLKNRLPSDLRSDECRHDIWISRSERTNRTSLERLEREKKRKRRKKREREMKNNGEERYFYLKKKNSSEDAFLEIETRREFSLSLSPCQIFNYGRSVQRYAAV